MRRICKFLILAVVTVTLSFSMPVEAAESEVKIAVNGEVQKSGGSIKLTSGEEIEITVDVNNMNKLYLALVDFFYDKELLELSSIKYNKDLVGRNKFQFEDNGITGIKARYGFSFLNPLKGYDGSANFVVIKGKTLKDGELKISEQNFKIQLIQREDDGKMKYMSYKMTGVDKVINSEEVKTNGPGPKIKDDGTDDRVVIDEEIRANDTTPITGGNEGGKKGEEAISKENGVGEINSSKNEENNEVVKKTEDKNNTTIYIAVASIAVIVLIAGGFMYYKKKKRTVVEPIENELKDK